MKIILMSIDKGQRMYIAKYQFKKVKDLRKLAFSPDVQRYIYKYMAKK